MEQPATKEDVHRLDMAINELRVIVHSLLDPEIAARFSGDWFGFKAPK